MVYQIRDKLNGESHIDEHIIRNIVIEIMNWIDANPSAKRDQLKAKQKELQSVWQSFVVAQNDLI